jgi:ABC-type transport system substrate-binding protein
MSVLRPTGPEPANVYWRRRLVVLAALVVVIVLVVVIIRALTGGGGTEQPAADPSPSQTTAAATGDPATCDPANLTVQLRADATDYPAGAQPLFTATMTNSGQTPCLLDAGDAQRQIVITSGNDRIWASTDCGEGEALQLLLAAGQADERQTQWDRTRSDEACSTGLPEPQPGTYQAVLTLDGVSTDPVVFTLG